LSFRAAVIPAVTHADATLSFVTTRPGPVRADLFDASGRRVRVLIEGVSLAPGVHQVPIEGRGEDGRPLGSGLYFYRLQTAERSATGRFVIVR
jgi:hypothetical protein